MLDHYQAILCSPQAKGYDRAALDHDWLVAAHDPADDAIIQAKAGIPLTNTGGTTWMASCSPSTTWSPRAAALIMSFGL